MKNIIKPILDREIQSLLKINQQIIEHIKTFGRDPYDNYFYREMIGVYQILKYCDLSIEILAGRSDADYKTQLTNKGEQKSLSLKTLKDGTFSKSQGEFQWDKQNDEIRRKQTLESESFVFNMFKNKYEFECLIYIPSQCDIIIDKLKELQAEKIKEIEECKRTDKKLSRDTIGFKPKFLFEFNENEAIFLDKTGKISKETFRRKFN